MAGSCCGRRSVAAQAANSTTNNNLVAAPLAQSQGSIGGCIRLTYTKEITGQPINIRGTTGQRYLFTATSKTACIHPNDVELFLRSSFVRADDAQPDTAPDVEPVVDAPLTPPEFDQVVADETVPLIKEESAEIPAINATDAAKELAAEYDLDLLTVDGTGSGGRVTKSDVQKVINALLAD